MSKAKLKYSVLYQHKTKGSKPKPMIIFAEHVMDVVMQVRAKVGDVIFIDVFRMSPE